MQKITWILNSQGEIGVKIDDAFLFYSLGESIVYHDTGVAGKNGSQMMWRELTEHDVILVTNYEEDRPKWKVLPRGDEDLPNDALLSALSVFEKVKRDVRLDDLELIDKTVDQLTRALERLAGDS
jgi:hypothetical protein